MGQIAACLTDLICLIEQRDAFGFTSPSKAADSASVKKKNRGRGEKGKEKHPRDISAAAGADLRTLAPLLEGFYLLAFNFLFAAAPRRLFQVIGRQQWPQAWRICQQQNSADDGSPLKAAVGIVLA